MRKWLRVSKTINGFWRCARACTDDHMDSAELAPCPIRKCSLQSPGTCEAAGAENEFRSGLFVIVEIHIVQARYHPAFTAAHRRHIDCEAVSGNAEVFTHAK